MEPVTCEEYEEVLRGGGDIPVYSGTLTQRGGFSIGGGVRGFIGSVLPLVKAAVGDAVGKAVKRNVAGIITDKMFRGMSLKESAKKRGREEFSRMMRGVASAVDNTPPAKKRKVNPPAKKTKKKTVKRRTHPTPRRTRVPDIFE